MKTQYHAPCSSVDYWDMSCMNLARSYIVYSLVRGLTKGC